MKVSYSASFSRTFLNQIDYISLDKPSAARAFAKAVLREILRIKSRPLSCRKSPYFDQINIREVIIKGYVLTFEINEKENEMVFFSFIKQNLPIT